jgi:ABC-type Mn2+/Zn2+ transport system permease subunit
MRATNQPARRQALHFCLLVSLMIGPAAVAVHLACRPATAVLPARCLSLVATR